LGRGNGSIASLVCAAIGFAIHRANYPYSRSGIAYWNALAWLAVYVFFILIISELRSLYQRERAWSRTDTLTGIPNRRSFFESLEIERNRARRYDRPLTLAYVDLDHFKAINDTFGHNTGDKLLGVVANAMKREIRQVDGLARLGGDEFAVLLPETNKVAAAAALGKLRSSLEAAMKQWNWPVAFSIGVVTFQSLPESVEEMISAADEAMYTAKKSGKGQLVMRPTA
jgi:diguanylate cyclase (GGDEF)-like protein